MLELFASLRGVSKSNIGNEVNKWISLMGELWNWFQAAVNNHIQKKCLFLGSYNITSSTAESMQH
jgi:hypothetical protein